MAKTNDSKKKNRAKKIFKKLKSFFKKQKVPKDMPPLAPIPSDFNWNGDTSEQAPETGMGSQSTSQVQPAPANNRNANTKQATFIRVKGKVPSRVIRVQLGPGTPAERLHRQISQNPERRATNTPTTQQGQSAPTNIHDANKEPPKRIRVTQKNPDRVIQVQLGPGTPAERLHRQISQNPERRATSTQNYTTGQHQGG